MAFYESLHEALSRYAAGVHEAAPPAGADAVRRVAVALGSIPTSYLEFLRAFDGARLFLESVILYGAAELRPGPAGQVYVGEVEHGSLCMDEAGVLRLVDEDAPDPLVAGSTLERWLDATVAREGLLIDRSGEFRDVFDEEGELTPAVRRKRAAAGKRRDPGAALPLLEEAELLLEEGQGAEAQAALEAALSLDPVAGPCLELLAALHRDAGRDAEAEALFVRAAMATPHPPLRASRLLDAALLSRERRGEHAAAAWRADPDHGLSLLGEARAALAAGDGAEADGLMRRLGPLMDALSAAPAATATRARTEHEALVGQLRIRQALRVV